MAHHAIDVKNDENGDQALPVANVNKMPGLGLGNPAPLGLLCFGMTTCMLMFIDTTWAEASFITTVMGYAMFYGGIAQALAGLLEFIKGNTFAATAFVSYGCFWMGWFLIKYLSNKTVGVGLPVSAFQVGQTLWFCLWGVFTLALFVVTLRKNHCLQTIFGTLFTTFFLLAGGVWSHRTNTAAGYVGFICGCSAIYTAFAEIYEEELGWKMPGLAPTKYI